MENSDEHESDTHRREAAGLAVCIGGLAAVAYFAPPEAWEVIGLQVRPIESLIYNPPSALVLILGVLGFPTLYWAYVRWKYAE